MAAVAAAAAAATLAAPARADVVTAAYSGSDQFIYEIIHMPDLDQRRDAGGPAGGLPNNGSMYCVPTSCMNMCLYAANHGFPGMIPGPGNYQSQALYGTATSSIELMGILMGTNPSSGTSGGPAHSGLLLWVLGSGLGGKLTVSHLYKSSSYTPTFTKMSQKALNGQLVSFAYGRYEIDGTYLGFPLVGDRTGGHMVTLSKAAASGSSKYLLCRDPADDGTNSTQSMFTNRELDVTDGLFFFCSSPACLRSMSALEYPSGDGKARLIDSYQTIKPKLGYTFTETGGQLQIFVGLPFVPPPGWTSLASSHLFDAVNVVDLIIDPDEVGWYFVGADPSDPDMPVLGRADALSGQTEVIADLATAQAFVIGRKLDLYVLEDDKVLCINPEAEVPVAGSVPLPGPADALTYDELADEVVVLAVEERSMLRYRAGLPAGVPPTTVPVPDAIPLAGAGMIAINPSDSSTWVVSEASSSIWGWSGGVAGGAGVVEVALPQFEQPSCVEFDDTGRMYVTDLGGVHELVQDEELGWQPAPAPEFADLPSGQRMRVTRSHTNYDPAEHAGPGWNNIDPDELDHSGTIIPDCLADLNGDGMVAIDDLLALLAAWGSAPGFEPADFEPPGGDGAVDILDLLRLLAAWGPCP
jgi:hypothetical protein